MITIVLEAGRIPEGTKVRKVTGTTFYTLQRSVNVYMPGDNRKITTEGMVFLFGDNAINGYPVSTKFALDLNDRDALEFLQTLLEEDK